MIAATNPEYRYPLTLCLQNAVRQRAFLKPQQIAERIVALKAVGVDLVLAGFLHFQEEVEYFGKRVLPLVRALEAKAGIKQVA